MYRSTKNICGVVAAALATTAASALAQAPSTPVHKAFCVLAGASPMEPVGDRAGHALQVANYTCRTEGGPMEGSVMTGTNIIEWDAGKGVILSGTAVIRKPGSLVSVQMTEGTMTPIMTDGKPTGVTASGKGVMKHGSGNVNVAALSGKTYSFTSRSTGAGQFVIETIYD